MTHPMKSDFWTAIGDAFAGLVASLFGKGEHTAIAKGLLVLLPIQGFLVGYLYHWLLLVKCNINSYHWSNVSDFATMAFESPLMLLVAAGVSICMIAILLLVSDNRVQLEARIFDELAKHESAVTMLDNQINLSFSMASIE